MVGAGYRQHNDVSRNGINRWARQWRQRHTSILYEVSLERVPRGALNHGFAKMLDAEILWTRRYENGLQAFHSDHKRAWPYLLPGDYAAPPTVRAQ